MDLMDMFDKHYTKLVRGLPAGAMWDDFVGKGLLRDDSLRQDVLAEPTDSGKTRKLLESMRQGMSNGTIDTFLKFVEAMDDYGKYAKNQAVLNLAADIRKDLPEDLPTGARPRTSSGDEPDRRDEDKKISSSSLPRKDPPTLPDLLTSLKGVAKWDTLGTYLLPSDHISQIEKIRRSRPVDVDECKMQLFNHYLDVGELSWKKVVEALERSGYPHIAKKIKEEYY